MLVNSVDRNESAWIQIFACTVILDKYLLQLNNRFIVFLGLQFSNISPLYACSYTLLLRSKDWRIKYYMRLMLTKFA